MADSIAHTANRITYRGSTHYEQTRARFGKRVPLIAQAVALKPVVADAAGAGIVAEVTARVGPIGFVSVTRVDQGACPASAANTLRKSENARGEAERAP